MANPDAALGDVLYCHASEAEEYVQCFVSQAHRLRTKYYEYSVFKYLEAAQHQLQSKAVELARSEDRYQWGRALLTVLRIEAGVWQTELHQLVKLPEKKDRFQSREQRPSFIKQEPSDMGGSSGVKEVRVQSRKEGLGGDSRVKTATMLGNKKICTKLNSKDHCVNNDCTDEHTCNAILQSGRTCGKNAPLDST